MEARLKITDLKVSSEYDDDAQSLVAKVSFRANVGVSDMATLARLQGYVNNECSISGTERQLNMGVNKETGEIEE